MAESLEEKRARIQKKLEEKQAKLASNDPLLVEEPISKTESFLRGGAQGASLGLADELTGAGETLSESLKGNVNRNFEDIVKEYQKHRDESRSAYKAAEEANPYSYGGGQLVGGIAPVVASGGLGVGIQGAGKLGAIAGLGTSDVDLTSPDTSAADKVKGAGSDMVLGAGLGYATASVPAAFTALKNKTLPGKLFTSELSGKRVLGEDAGRAIEKQLGEAGSDVATGIQERLSKTAINKNKILEDLEKSGKKYDISDLEQALAEGEGQLPTSFTTEGDSARKAIKEPFTRAKDIGQIDPLEATSAEELMGTQLNPKQLDSFRRALGRLGYEKDLKDDQVIALAKRLSGKASEKLNTDVNPITGELVPNQLAKSNTDIQNLLKAQEILNVGGEGATEYGGKQILTPLTARLEKEGTSGIAARQKFEEAINALKQADPKYAEQAEKRLKDLAEQYGLNVESGTNFNVSHTGLLRQAARVPGYIGRGLHATDEAFGGLPGMIGKPVGKITEQVFKESGSLPSMINASDIEAAQTRPKRQFSEMSSEQMMNIAARLKGKGIDGVANKVEKAAQSNDPVQKAQAEFIVKQNPTARKQIENPDEE